MCGKALAIIFIIFFSSLDNTAPVLSNCPSDQTVFASQNAQFAVATWSAPTASDNSGDFVSINSDFSSGSQFPVGVTTVTYTATDSSGNTDTCQFTVSVIGQLMLICQQFGMSKVFCALLPIPTCTLLLFTFIRVGGYGHPSSSESEHSKLL